MQEAQSQDGAATASEESRENFNVAAYMARRSLSVAGIHFWREVWEEGKTAQAVKEIYKSILREYMLQNLMRYGQGADDVQLCRNCRTT